MSMFRTYNGMKPFWVASMVFWITMHDKNGGEAIEPPPPNGNKVAIEPPELGLSLNYMIPSPDFFTNFKLDIILG